VDGAERLAESIYPSESIHHSLYSHVNLIGEASRKLKNSGKLNPVHPTSQDYNDIAISALAHQIRAVVITKNNRDFELIRSVIDFVIDFPLDIRDVVS